MSKRVHGEDRSPVGSTTKKLIAAAGFALLAAIPPVASGEARERSGEEVVAAVCASCHKSGAQGAPRIGDRQAWARLASRGLTSLTDTAIKGVRNMPAHGGSAAVTDGEIERAITYMVNQSGGNWAEPVGDITSAAELRGKQIVESHCVKCHGTGVGGAPKVGDRAAWIKRLSRGLDALVRSAIHGHGPMPPRGGIANLTDSEIRSAVIHMFNPVGAAPQERSAVPARRPDPNHQRVDDLDVYLGVVSAASLRARAAKGGAERQMHGGIPSAAGFYHVNVSLFDAKSGVEIKDAQIEARVADPVMSGETKELEAVTLRNATSYGQYFQMGGKYPYTITLKIRRPGSTRVIETRFEYKH